MFDSAKTLAIFPNGLASEPKTNSFGQSGLTVEQVYSSGISDPDHSNSLDVQAAVAVSSSSLPLSTEPAGYPVKAEEQEVTPVSCCAVATEGLSEEEVRLANNVVTLWNGDRIATDKSRKERTDRRSELSEKLAQIKAVLAKRGCGGGWSDFLRMNKISRTTADRYVQKWEDSLKPKRMNCPTGAIRLPTDEEIQEKVARMTRRLKREFPDPASIKQFLDALVAALQV